MISDGRWMPQEVRLLEGLLPVGGVVVDAGANIGGFALPLAKHVGPDGQVHAFEPFRNIFQLLTANCALNGLTSCNTYHNALGSKPEKRVRRSPGLNAVGNPSKSFVVDQVASELLVHHDGQGRTEVVEVVRLDDKLDLTRLDAIKIDVESAEYEMLVGAERTIAAHAPLIYVEDSEADLARLLEPTRVMRLLQERHNYECLNLVQAGLTAMTSLLCVPSPRVREVQARLREIDFRITT
uniref:Methyltransferase FkbM domain-containing protein n=1 Tax=Zooxanthella nutricula TaxID=1333877 RepID=A0A7S2QFA6_9DINO